MRDIFYTQWFIKLTFWLYQNNRIEGTTIYIGQFYKTWACACKVDKIEKVDKVDLWTTLYFFDRMCTLCAPRAYWFFSSLGTQSAWRTIQIIFALSKTVQNGLQFTIINLRVYTKKMPLLQLEKTKRWKQPETHI